jgi:hypothetical protein
MRSLTLALSLVGASLAAPAFATTFFSEVVDTVGNPGGGTSIVRDANGDLHVSYINCDNGELRFAERIGGVWSTQVIDSRPGFSHYFFTSMALDGSGDPHIAYVHPSSTGGSILRYATRHGGQWSTKTVDSLGTNMAQWPSIAIAPSGQPVVAYEYLAVTRSIRYAERAANGIWSIQTAFSGSPPVEVSLALDLAGEPQIAFGYIFQTEFHVVSRSGGIWTDVKVDSVADGYHTAGHTAGIVDASGDLHVVYQEYNYDAGIRLFKHATRHLGLWSIEVVDPNVGVLDPYGYYYPWNGLSLDVDGTLRASYCAGDDIFYGGSPYQLRMATLGPSGWVLEDVDTVGSDGYWNSIAVGGGHIAVSYERGELFIAPPYQSELRVAVDASDVGVSTGRAPERLAVSAYPNPARTSSTWRVRLALPRDERVSVDVFDLSGRRVWSRPAEWIPAGSRNVALTPGALPSGVYLARVSAGSSGTRTLRLALVR